MLRVFMRVPGVDRIDFSGVHNQRTPVDSRAHHPTCAHMSDSAETDTLGSDRLGCVEHRIKPVRHAHFAVLLDINVPFEVISNRFDTYKYVKARIHCVHIAPASMNQGRSHEKQSAAHRLR